jgi:hypothetical protein
VEAPFEGVDPTNVSGYSIYDTFYLNCKLLDTIVKIYLRICKGVEMWKQRHKSTALATDAIRYRCSRIRKVRQLQHPTYANLG